MNKKGITIPILITLIISIGLLFTGIYTYFSGVNTKSNEDEYNEQVNLIIESAKLWVKQNKVKGDITISLCELENNDFIGNLINPLTDKEIPNDSKIVYENGNYNFILGKYNLKVCSSDNIYVELDKNDNTILSIPNEYDDVKEILIRENVENVIQRLNTRGGDFSYLREVKMLDERKRNLLSEVENLKNEKNRKSKLIGEYKRNKQDTTELLNEVNLTGENIVRLEKDIDSLDEKIKYYMLRTPNLVSLSTKVGKDETENREIRKFKEPTKFNFTPKDHVELAEKLGILDFDRAAKITGARFVIYKGLGARLERALISFMMDLHSKQHGYTEIMPPYIVNGASMLGTGQFPKFKDDAYKVTAGQGDDGDWYLNPTAEVPTINMYRDEIIDGDKLPIKYCSYTTAFRAEAGSAGRDTRGILRQHQFNKVELIKFTRPEDSYNELEQMLNNSEEVLKQLDIPYHVVELCTGDMGFGMAKTFDIEVWLPGQNCYREIGSISNAEDFQARRANIRFRRTKDSKTEYVHTLNGSGLAVGRTVIAILENYQQEDGSIQIPEVLIPYMGVKEIR